MKKIGFLQLYIISKENNLNYLENLSLIYSNPDLIDFSFERAKFDAIALIVANIILNFISKYH